MEHKPLMLAVKPSRRRWMVFALLAALPLALYLFLTERASWRPRTLHIGGSVYDIAFLPKGNLLAVGSDRLQLWDIERGSLYRPMPVPAPRLFVKNIVLSPDGNLVAASANWRHRVDRTFLWSVPTGKLLGTLNGVDTVVFSPDGRRLTAINGGFHSSWQSAKPDVTVCQARTGKPVDRINVSAPRGLFFWGIDTSASGGGSWVTRRLSPDARWGVVKLEKPRAESPHFIDDFGGVLLFETQGKKRRRLLPISEAGTQMDSMEFSPHGRVLAVTSIHKRVPQLLTTTRLRDVETGRLISTWKAKTDESLESFSPDGRLLLSGTGYYPYTVSLRDARTGRLHWTLKGRTRANSLAFSPDGALLASDGYDDYDTRVLLWDTRTGQLLRELKGHQDAVTDVAFSPDGATLASGSGDGTVKIWRVR